MVEWIILALLGHGIFQFSQKSLMEVEFWASTVLWLDTSSYFMGEVLPRYGPSMNWLVTPRSEANEEGLYPRRRLRLCCKLSSIPLASFRSNIQEKLVYKSFYNIQISKSLKKASDTTPKSASAFLFSPTLFPLAAFVTAHTRRSLQKYVSFIWHRWKRWKRRRKKLMLAWIELPRRARFNFLGAGCD